jgi:hypothetical protein
MRKIRIIIAMSFVVGTFWASGAQAQETNAPLSLVEIFEYQTGTVVVRGSVLVGTVSTQTGNISVRAKESVQPSIGGRKEYGIAVVLNENGRHDDTTVIDEDEVASFLNGIDYISKANHSMTPLPDYDVSYTTRAWLRLVVYTSDKRPGAIQTALQSGHSNGSRILLSSDELARFQGLIQQARAKLDSLRSGK